MRRLLLLAFALLSAVAIAGGAGAQSRFIEFPDVDGYQTLVVDLHIHSIFSDGDVWPSIRVQESLLDGLDLMARKPKNKELAAKGKIAIQDHGLPFWVRNIRIKSL